MITLRNSHFKINSAEEILSKGLGSNPIPWNIVKLMQEKYLINPDALKIQTDEGVSVLKGLSIDAQHVQNLLEGKNNEGIVVQAPATQLFLMLGVRDQDLNKPPTEQFFTIVVAGIDAQNNLLTASVYDNLSSCPSICPNIP
jgi:hypothetical protein